MNTGEHRSPEDWKFATQPIAIMFMFLPPTLVAGRLYVKKL